MAHLFVVNNPKNWPLKVPGVEVVPARAYLTDPTYSDRRARVFNLCRSYRYQSIGYYVSMLAEARGHKPQPDLDTIQEMKSPAIMRITGDELDALIQQSLQSITTKEFVLSVYFGAGLAERHKRLARALFDMFRAPMIRAHFVRNGTRWRLQHVGPISGNEIPENHHDFVVQAANTYFKKGSYSAPKKKFNRYDLAILYDPTGPSPPSDGPTIKKFIRAAAKVGMDAEVIDRTDFARLPNFDALFIRETTEVNHHTYRFAQRAHAEGLVVIDDPQSIVRCTNKVYLAELLAHHGLRAPKTVIVHKDNVCDVSKALGFPVILKSPDSAFSLGVTKAESEKELEQKAAHLLASSDLIIAQEFVESDFDWRVGLIDGEPLYVCKYFMARKHWQIVKREKGKDRWGDTETVAVKDAPRNIVETATRAAKLIGNGLYGVDMKESGRRAYVIEVNDNPTIESTVEDKVLKDELYLTIMKSFVRRIEQKREKR